VLGDQFDLLEMIHAGKNIDSMQLKIHRNAAAIYLREDLNYNGKI